MSKVQMPDASFWIKIRKSNGDVEICGDGPGYRSPGHDALFDYTPLITTDQAEAYADARVREALEEAAQACENHSDGLNMLGGAYVACAQAIRALARKEGA